MRWWWLNFHYNELAFFFLPGKMFPAEKMRLHQNLTYLSEDTHLHVLRSTFSEKNFRFFLREMILRYFRILSLLYLSSFSCATKSKRLNEVLQLFFLSHLFIVLWMFYYLAVSENISHWESSKIVKNKENGRKGKKGVVKRYLGGNGFIAVANRKKKKREYFFFFLIKILNDVDV